MQALFTSSYRWIFISGLGVFLITAYFSTGYYHPDEHFQILEFCNYKLGNSPQTDLPWEFNERIRPALQPALAFVIIKIANLFGVYSPFSNALILRLLTAFLSWLIICKISLFLTKDFFTESGKKIFLMLSLFLWFIPSLSVRFNSENYSAIAFLLAVHLILQFFEDNPEKKYYKLVFAGIILGLSFFFRFQIAFAIIGSGLWLLLVKKISLNHLGILIASGLISIICCTGVDYWFYENLEFTPFNYFFSNIIEQKANNWGTRPWWYYFNKFIIQAAPPISIFLLAFFMFGLIKNPKNIFSWSLVPYIIAHIIVGHKELRFMFPIVFGFIYLACLGIDNFIATRRYMKAGRIVLYTLIVINIPILILKMRMPAQEAINYYQYLYDYSSNQKTDVLCIEKDVYELSDLPVNFYKSPNVNSIVFNNDREISNYLDIQNPDSVLLLDRKLKADREFTNYTSERIYCILPEWCLRYNFNDWQKRARIWSFDKLRKKIN